MTGRGISTTADNVHETIRAESHRVTDETWPPHSTQTIVYDGNIPRGILAQPAAQCLASTYTTDSRAAATQSSPEPAQVKHLRFNTSDRTKRHELVPTKSMRETEGHKLTQI